MFGSVRTIVRRHEGISVKRSMVWQTNSFWHYGISRKDDARFVVNPCLYVQLVLTMTMEPKRCVVFCAAVATKG